MALVPTIESVILVIHVVNQVIDLIWRGQHIALVLTIKSVILVIHVN